MNIAIVTTWFSAGAGYVSRAYREILEKDHTVYVYARGGINMKGDQMWDDSFVTWAPLNFYKDINVNHFLKWLKKKKIDIVLFNEQRYWEPVIQSKNAGYLIGSYIDYYTEETVPLFDVYDFLICNTQKHFSVFEWHRNCLFIPWGTNVDIFRPVKKLPAPILTFIISLGWEGNYIGDRKGLFFAVEAFKKVSGNCRLKVFSQIELQDCRLEWQKLINGDSRIQFIVGTFEPFPFCEGDIYIYPSRLDGIGLSLPEAISSGLAIITTNNSPMNEFVIDGYNGKLIDISRFISRPDGYYWPQSIVSVESLVNIIEWYLKNPIMSIEHGKNARQFALNHLDWTKNSKDLSRNIMNIYCTNEKLKLPLSLVLNSSRIDRKLYPSITFRFLLLVRDILKKIGISITVGKLLFWVK